MFLQTTALGAAQAFWKLAELAYPSKDLFILCTVVGNLCEDLGTGVCGDYKLQIKQAVENAEECYEQTKEQVSKMTGGEI